MSSVKFCTRCGKDLALKVAYCDRCGALVNQSPSSGTNRADKNLEKPRIERILKDVLGLDGWPVAVKLLNSSSKIPSGVKEIGEFRRHCEIIQKVRRYGETFFAPPSKQKCKVAGISLGLMKPTEEFREHQRQELFETQHRFKTEALLRKFLENTPTVPDRHSAILYGPLGAFPTDPDVVVLVCDTLQAMKIIQAYQYATGKRANASMGGLFSLCADAVATPYSQGTLNIAIGCEGAREHGGLKDYELSVGFPYRMAETLTDGLISLAEQEATKEEHK